MASPATFTIRQVGPGDPETTITESTTEATEKPVKRTSVKDKRDKDKEEKKKSRKPPGIMLLSKAITQSCCV